MNEETLKNLSDEELKKLYDENIRLYAIKNNTQMALKILINSFYGALGNSNFRYYNLTNAEAVTSAGQSAIKYIAYNIDSWLEKVIYNEEPKSFQDMRMCRYIDTDSNYFSLEKLLEKLPETASYEQKFELLKKFADGPMQQKINSLYEEYARRRNVPKNLMFMDREAISVQGGFFVKKKKYALLVDDMEGKRYDPPEYKIMGLEAIKSGSYPEHVRKVLKAVIELIVTKDEEAVQEYIATVKKDFFENWTPDDFCFITTVNNIDKWVDSNGNFVSGAPIQSKAAHNYNKFVEKNKLGFNLISEGDKIKFIYLKEPNIIGRAIAYNKESDLESIKDLVDYHTHWEKNVLKPIMIMLEAVDYAPEKRNTLF